MRISFLLTEFGFTGGPVNLLKFMDKLSERGYEVYAITPAKRIAWRPGLSKTIIKQMTHPSTLQRIQDYPISCASYIYRKLPRFHHISQAIYRSYYSYYLNTLTRNLLSKWIPSDITVATHCLTAYAAFALMDKTIPLYYIQHFEELFFQDELVQKLARLTYFMPIELITGGAWVRDQIIQRTGRVPHLLNPGFEHSVFYPQRDINDKYRNYKPLKIVSYGRALHFSSWNESVEAMRIVYKELGTDNVEWNVFWFHPRPDQPPDLKLNFVNHRGGELAELYSDSHICLCLGWYSGFPGAQLEPMACGCALVTAGLGVDETAVNGVNSLVVPPRRPDLIAEAIIKLAKEPELASKLAHSGIETAKKYDWEKATDNLEHIMQITMKDYKYKDNFSDVQDLIKGQFNYR